LSKFVFEVYPRTRTQAFRRPLADSGINDRLVKLRPLIYQTCLEFIDVTYFGAVNWYCIVKYARTV